MQLKRTFGTEVMRNFINNLGLWLTILGLFAIMGFATVSTPEGEKAWVEGKTLFEEEVRDLRALVIAFYE